jgi:hypothetical protein
MDEAEKELVHDTKIITDALSKAISGIDGANDAVCHARIFANGYGGISAFDAVRKIMTLHSANPSLIG